MSSLSQLEPSQKIPLRTEGHSVLSEFELAPELVHLNHGSYGALPHRVVAEQQRWQARIERDPTGFFQDVYPVEIRRSAETAASYFGGSAKDWVFCENATVAINSVLASFSLRPGDEILTTSHAYGAVLKAMGMWAMRKGAALKIAALPAIIESDSQVTDLVVQAFTDRTRLLVIDHVTSPTATILPIEQIAKTARSAGIAVLIDGAHGPGQIPLNVPAIGADWYTGNAHKWFFAPRGCGLLWSAPKRQGEVLPVVLSHGTDRGYRAAFDWVGTRDVTPGLNLKAGGAAHESFGGTALMERNRLLATRGAEIVSHAVSAEPSAPAEMRAAMVSLRLGSAFALSKDPIALRRALREEGIVVPVNCVGEATYLRLSAQIYNETSDYERCARALKAALQG